ncbi:MAG: anthranilate synthase component I, partial [Actinomycetia bacterium]|nr:anthranilate synthase component I [Actinomycetes bacterium]
MRTSLSEDAFIDLASRYSVVPVAIEVLADRLTPVAVFDRLVGTEDGFLLESVEGGERWGRWSFVGWSPAFTVTSRAGTTEADADVELEGDTPLDVLEALVDRFSVP